MASRKRARTSSTGGSSSSSTSVAPTITLDGGEPCPTKQVALWRSGRLTDTVVTVEGATFAAHRLVLASACDYFDRHYDHEHMRDADHPKLLEHVTAAAFEPLLGFLYEGACSFDASLLAPVLQAAHFLGVAPLERAAVVALTARLSPSNALTAWTWGEELELPELAEAAKETALKAFDEVEKIEDATLAQVQALVADERLTAKSEEVVFSAVARFAEAKLPAEAELLEVLRNVRFAHMSKEFLHGTVRVWPVLENSLAGQKLLFELVSGPAGRPRPGFGARFLYVMGGRSSSLSASADVSVYDTASGTWSAGTPMPLARKRAGAAVLDGKIYVLGGSTADSTRSIHAFDPSSGAWTEVTPMPVGRHLHAAAVVGGKIYAIGGDTSIGSNGRTNSVDAFDPQAGTWAGVAAMPYVRASFAAVVLDGKIYAIGGCDGGGAAMNAVDVYNPATNTWTTGPPMGMRRAGHSATVLGGKIYVALSTPQAKKNLGGGEILTDFCLPARRVSAAATAAVVAAASPATSSTPARTAERKSTLVGATEWEVRAALATGPRACVRVGSG